MGSYEGINFDDHLDSLLTDLITRLKLPKATGLAQIIDAKRFSEKDPEDRRKEFKHWYSYIISKLDTKNKKSRFKNELKSIFSGTSLQDKFIVTRYGVEIKDGVILDVNDSKSLEQAREMYASVLQKYVRRIGK